MTGRQWYKMLQRVQTLCPRVRQENVTVRYGLRASEGLPVPLLPTIRQVLLVTSVLQRKKLTCTTGEKHIPDLGLEDSKANIQVVPAEAGVEDG